MEAGTQRPPAWYSVDVTTDERRRPRALHSEGKTRTLEVLGAVVGALASQREELARAHGRRPGGDPGPPAVRRDVYELDESRQRAAIRAPDKKV